MRQARLSATPPVTQEDLAGRMAAQLIQIDRSAISRIESGARYVMDYEVQALAAALHVSVACLFDEE